MAAPTSATMAAAYPVAAVAAVRHQRGHGGSLRLRGRPPCHGALNYAPGRFPKLLLALPAAVGSGGCSTSRRHGAKNFSSASITVRPALSTWSCGLPVSSSINHSSHLEIARFRPPSRCYPTSSPSRLPVQCSATGFVIRSPIPAVIASRLLGLAATVAQLLAITIQGNAAVLQATCNASLKLFVICGGVAWMRSVGYLPATTSSMLSQIAFKVFIPAFLASRLGSTLASHSDISKLLFVPLVASAQILLGAVLGKLASLFLNATAEMWDEHCDIRKGQRCRLSPGDQDRILTSACTFGNSLTLPLVYLTSLLKGAEADRAVGYVALFLLGWSPWLWSVGYRMLTTADEDKEESKAGSGMTLQEFVKRVVNPPLIAVLVGAIIGATPLAAIFFPNSPAARKAALVAFANGSSSPLVSAWQTIFSTLQFCGKTVMETCVVLGGATLPVQSIVLASSLFASPSSNKPGEPAEYELDPRVPYVVSFVRHVANPVAMLGLVGALRGLHLLPADPICTLVLMAQACMPSAQNLVLLPQLQEKTRKLAAPIARLLLWQYVLAMVPLTLWLSYLLAVFV